MTYTAAIIIPHFNDGARLARCLEALAPQMRPEVEGIVIDNGSHQPPAVPAPFRLAHEPLPGAANARNRGVALSAAPRLFFIDADCLPAPDWLDTALAVADRGDLVGGAVSVFDETPPPRTGPQLFEAIFAFDNRTYVEQKGFSVTANLLTTRAVFDAVGPFEHGLSEDFDWCHRARDKGFSIVYAESLRVGHPSRGDWAALRKKWKRLTEESFALNGTGPRAKLAWAMRGLIMPLSILAHAPRVLSAPGANAEEKLRAVGTLARIRLVRMGWMFAQLLRTDGAGTRG